MRVIFLLFLTIKILLSQTPLIKSNYTRLTSYDELKNFVFEIDKKSDLVKAEVLTKTVEGREIFVLFFSCDEFGKDPNKLKVLFFAQQHGNEQSGKEGALLLIDELTKAENQYLFHKLDLAIIPQMNPDGSEKNQRRNSNNVDLNRNHLILTENETIALHKLFDVYNFEVTLDVHEYSPYTESWKEFGYYKNADEQVGILSNPNISESIQKYQKEKVLPFIRDYFGVRDYSFCEYVVGGPPDKERLRHSTVDINDGRQSFGILNSLSFILEGKNGIDSYLHNIKRRAHGQFEAMMGLLKFCYDNSNEIKNLIKLERKSYDKLKEITLRADHFHDGSEFILPVTRIEDSVDTLITIKNYSPKVKQLEKVKIPKGYLVPRNDSLLINLLKRHSIKFLEKIPGGAKFYRYEILSIDSILLEGEYLKDLRIKKNRVKELSSISEYVYVPLNQLKRNLIVLTFEPQSMVGIIQYPHFKYLTEKKFFSVIRVEF